ncbi:MAG: gamma-glutamylcyclotransferase family protein [Candidatus Binatia bacterium]
MSETLWYFAYGSNMSRAIFVEQRRIQPSASTWGWLASWRLCFDLPVGPGERGVANLVPDETARVCGVLHHITHAEAAHLDTTEGVTGGFYARHAVAVAAASGETITAFIYHSKFGSPGRKPSPRYMGLLLAGADEHGLPPEYVAYLRRFELAHDERT